MMSAKGLKWKQGLTGREAHLKTLQMIFFDRGATWADFGDFLCWLLSVPENPRVAGLTVPGVRLPTVSEISCRHNSGGRHFPYINDAASKSGRYPMLESHPRYTRPCLGIGSWEANKGPGLVVDDVCNKARAFLNATAVTRLAVDGGTKDSTYVCPASSEDEDSQMTGMGESQVSIPAWPAD